jgi:hypothetical protein
MDVEALCVYFGLAVYVVCWVFGLVWCLVEDGCIQTLMVCKYDGLMVQTWYWWRLQC